MTQPLTTSPFDAHRAQSRASARSLAVAVVIAAQAIAVLALFWVVLTAVTGTPARADELKADRLLAYAPPADARIDDAFAAQPHLEARIVDHPHPFNDAWMGMTVRTADGATAGYVSDAFVNANGSIDALVITPADAATLPHAVEVPARFARLGDEAVHIEMTLPTLRAQAPFVEDIAVADTGS